MYEEQFSKRLAELRTKKGVSARDMSLSIGQNAGYIRTIENGSSFPTMSAFFYICEYLNVTPKEFLDRWVRAVRRGIPMVVSNAETIRAKYPDEYSLYQRLGIQSVLAIPLEPRPVALIAVRNPKRYICQTSMLKLLAYVLLVAYNDSRMVDGLNMTLAPENIKSSHDIFISLFGELKIYTSRGVLRESDLKLPKISRLLTYLLLSQKKTVPPMESVQNIWPEEMEDAEVPGKNMKYLIYRLRQAFSLISDEQFVLSTAFGYQLNPSLHITTDFQKFDELTVATAKATSVVNKIGLMEKTVELYQGKLLSSAEGEHWLVHTANRYHFAYMSTANELLKRLMTIHAYDLIHQYAALALTIAPENTKAYYWLIQSYLKQNMEEMATGELVAARQKLPDEEYQKLLQELIKQRYYVIPLSCNFHATSVQPHFCAMIAKQF